jgi:hypothetical protein
MLSWFKLNIGTQCVDVACHQNHRDYIWHHIAITGYCNIK